jgi:hypothetical protein
MKKKNKFKKGQLYFRIAVVAFFVIFLFLALFRIYILKNEPIIYGKAKITDFERGGGVPPWFEYRFLLNDNIYKSQYSIASKLSKESNDSLRTYIGKYYVVKISQTYPSLNELLLDYKLDSAIMQPAGGWTELPRSQLSVD